MIDFKEAKALKNGEAPPSYVVRLLHESMQSGETDPESVIYICKMKDRSIETRYSDMLLTEGIGMLQVGINGLVDKMRY
jgi:hypothetical protein